MTIRLTVTFAIAALVAAPAWAGPQVGTLTRIEGTVKLLFNPSKKVEGAGPHVLYESTYYHAKDGKVGDRLEQGNIIRTTPGSKVRLVYDNGDQINVAPGTAYKVTWDKDTDKGKAQVNLMYGKIRAVVGKGGPRSTLTIKTRSATMGVRGTDFFVADNGSGKGGTEISVLRGKVAVKPETKAAKPVDLGAGFSAEIPPPPPPKEETETEITTQTQGDKGADQAVKKPEPAPEPAPAPVVVRKTTQEELVVIQKVVGSSRVDLQACKLEYSIVSPK